MSMHRTVAAATILIGIGGLAVAAQRGQGGAPGLGALTTPAANPLTPEKVILGRQLFFDVSLSADGKTSCATCHDPTRAFTDGRAVARGVHNSAGTRNTQSLVNVGHGRSFFWDGRAESLELQALEPMKNPKEMGLSHAEIESRAGLPASEVAAALASYMRTIRSSESRFDWYRAGHMEVLTADEREGFEVFRRSLCGFCHGGPNLTNENFHNTGVGVRNGVPTDNGRFNVSKDEADRGAFKTPTLRDIALTAPYMHDGSIATLEEVVDFYAKGGIQNPNLDTRMKPIQISPEEKRQLVAFLKSLSGRITEGLPGIR
jgi:cytochrome c peroxidase